MKSRLIVGALAAGLLVGCGGEKSLGQTTYERYCYVCHAAGSAGAPRFGQPDDWVGRLDQSDPAILQKVIDGIPPAMPPRGLCASCDEASLRAATDYLLDSVRGENR